MVKLMVTPAITQQPGAVSYHGAGVGYLDTAATEHACGNALGALDSSACVFWCAVALGALAKGSPIESVSRRVLRTRFHCRLPPGQFRLDERV